MQRCFIASITLLSIAFPAATNAATGPGSNEAITYVPAFLFVDAAAGSSAQLEVLVQNQSRADAGISVRLLDMTHTSSTDSTAFEYLPVGEAPRGAGRWLTLRNDTLQVDAGTEETVRLQLDVPEEASAGGHYAALQVTATDPRTNAAEVEIDYANHIPILVTVDGDAQRDLRVTVHPDRRWRWSGGRARWSVELHNAGDVHEVVSGRLQVDGLVASPRNLPVRGGILLPGERRTQDFDVELRAAPDIYAAQARIEVDDAPPATGASPRLLLLPWWILAIVAVGISVIWWRLRHRRRSWSSNELG